MSVFEMNNITNIRKDADMAVNSKLNKKSPIVEIFSAMAFGEDVSKYGKKVDAVNKQIKELSQRAYNGDLSAKAELNTIMRYTVEPKLMKAIQLFNFMGTFNQIGYDEQPMLKTYKHESIKSNFQANHGDVPFAVTSWKEIPVATQTISSGYAVDYRELASGNLNKAAEGMDQVKVDLMNKAMYYAIYKLYNGIKNATGIKYFAEAAGIAKASVDDVLKKVRRFGRPAIMGDYSVVSQLNDFAGIESTSPAITGLSEAVMEEIRQTGLLKTYNGSPVVELPNQYDLTKLNNAGDNFKTLMPEGLLFFAPQGTVAPFQMFQRGALTSMTGQDVVAGVELTRFDLEFGAELVDERAYEIALLSDSNFEVPAI